MSPEALKVLDVAAILADIVYNDPEQDYAAKRLAASVIRMAEIAQRDRHAAAR